MNEIQVNNPSREAMLEALGTASEIAFEGADWPGAPIIAENFRGMIRKPIEKASVEVRDEDDERMHDLKLCNLQAAISACETLLALYLDARHTQHIDTDWVCRAGEIACEAFGCNTEGEPLA